MLPTYGFFSKRKRLGNGASPGCSAEPKIELDGKELVITPEAPLTTASLQSAITPQWPNEVSACSAKSMFCWNENGVQTC
jgi:hypothetical protein